MEHANSVSGRCLKQEWKQPMEQRREGRNGQCRAEAPGETQVLEIALPRTARMSEEQAVDESVGCHWRCPRIADVARARKLYEETPGLNRGSMG